ncbi:MAG: uracil-DNA glycosylase [Phycisphaerae bacterium]
MTDEFQQLTAAARQLLAIENLLGGDYVPAERNPLPEIEIAAVSAPAGASDLSELSPDEKAAALAELNDSEVAMCTRCVLSRSRTNTVFGEANHNADLVFVGEAPGQEEDLSGRPFVGRAGELLGKMIAAMGLTREDVFICNVVKCRPPNNRTPAPEEVAACWNYLVRQLQIIRPRCIVTLGNPATKALLDTRTGITRMRGNFHPLPAIGEGLEGIPVMPTFHPAYVLRQYTQQNRRMVWSDLQQVMQLLELPEPKKP